MAMRSLDTSKLDVRIEFMPATKVVTMRHLGSYETAGETFKQFYQWCSDRGLIAADTRYLGICHDDPSDANPDKIRYDCAITVDRDVRPEGRVQPGSVFGGEYAITTYRGPYDNLQQVYDFLFHQWLPASGREAADGPVIEMYLNDPDTTPPADLLTGLCVPLEWW
jgi:AraC family transcriptional regulator